EAARAAVEKAGVLVEVVARRLGAFSGVEVDKTFQTSGGSVMYDAVLVAGGKGLPQNGDARTFVYDAWCHCKPVAAVADGKKLLDAAQVEAGDGVVTGADAKAVSGPFLKAMEQG